MDTPVQSDRSAGGIVTSATFCPVCGTEQSEDFTQGDICEVCCWEVDGFETLTEPPTKAEAFFEPRYGPNGVISIQQYRTRLLNGDAPKKLTEDQWQRAARLETAANTWSGGRGKEWFEKYQKAVKALKEVEDKLDENSNIRERLDDEYIVAARLTHRLADEGRDL